MKRSGPLDARLVCVFLLGCLLFNFPLISLFNVDARVLGVPLLYAYLFAAWMLLVVVLGILMERSD